MENNELTHWGIKGMKWGVRRYQNKNGSLTALGRKMRRNENSGESEKNTEETVEERRKRILNSTDAKEIYKNRDILSTAEINERINRIDTEAKLASRIVEESKKTGADYVNNKLQSTTTTLNNALSLYKKVDETYSTVSNSAIGKTLAKKLGLEPPKKEFNLNEFWKNRNKMSTKEIQETAQRLASEKRIEDEINRRKKQQEKETADKAAKEAAQKQVDDYNAQREKSTYRKKGDDIIDNKTATENSKGSSRLRLENIDRYEATGKDVFGEGTSKHTERKNDTVIDAEEGKDYCDLHSDTKMSNVDNSQLAIGQQYVAGLLEDKSGK